MKFSDQSDLILWRHPVAVSHTLLCVCVCTRVCWYLALFERYLCFNLKQRQSSVSTQFREEKQMAHVPPVDHVSLLERGRLIHEEQNHKQFREMSDLNKPDFMNEFMFCISYAQMKEGFGWLILVSTSYDSFFIKWINQLNTTVVVSGRKLWFLCCRLSVLFFFPQLPQISPCQVWKSCMQNVQLAVWEEVAAKTSVWS